MICPKCGHENPEGTIFCEKCDWQLNKKCKKSNIGRAEKVVIFMYISLVVSVASVITGAMGFGIFGVVCGAIGMFTSSYSLTLVRITDDYSPKHKKMIMILTAITGVLSTIGFIYGLYLLVK